MSALSAEEVSRARLQDGVMTVSTGPVGIWGMTETSPHENGSRLVLCWSNSPQRLFTKEEQAAMTPLQLKELLLPLYHNWYPPVPTLLHHATGPEAVRPPLKGPIFDMPDLSQWWEKRVILIGDAAHASVPGGHKSLGTAVPRPVLLSVYISPHILLPLLVSSPVLLVPSSRSGRLHRS